jgi:hypothetical protein
VGQNSRCWGLFVGVYASFVWTGEFGWVEVCSAQEVDGGVC